MKLGFNISYAISAIIFIGAYCWVSDVRFFATPMQEFNSALIFSGEVNSVWREVNIKSDIASDGVAMGRRYFLLLGNDTIYGMNYGPEPKYYIPSLQNTNTAIGIFWGSILSIVFL
jgi:hypothetical protein